MNWPQIIEVKGGRLIISQLRSGEISMMVDYGKGSTGVIMTPLDACEASAVLLSCARKPKRA